MNNCNSALPSLSMFRVFRMVAADTGLMGSVEWIPVLTAVHKLLIVALVWDISLVAGVLIQTIQILEYARGVTSLVNSFAAVSLHITLLYRCQSCVYNRLIVLKHFNYIVNLLVRFRCLL